MEDTDFTNKNILDQVREYISTRIELAKIEFIEKSSAAVSKIMVGVILAVISFMILLLLSFGFSYYLAEQIGSTLGGFSIVAGIYLLIFIILILIRKRAIEIPLVNYQIKKNFKN